MPSIIEDNNFASVINVRDAMKAADAAQESGDRDAAIKWINTIYEILDQKYMSSSEL
jgi:ribosomal protein S20